MSEDLKIVLIGHPELSIIFHCEIKVLPLLAGHLLPLWVAEILMIYEGVLIGCQRSGDYNTDL